MTKEFKSWTKDHIRQLLADNYATCREIADADFGFTMKQVMGIKGNMVKQAMAAAKKRPYTEPSAKPSAKPLPEDSRELLAQLTG